MGIERIRKGFEAGNVNNSGDPITRRQRGTRIGIPPGQFTVTEFGRPLAGGVNGTSQHREIGADNLRNVPTFTEQVNGTSKGSFGDTRKLAESVAQFVLDYTPSPEGDNPRSMSLKDLDRKSKRIVGLVEEPVSTIFEAVDNHTRLMRELIHPDIHQVMEVVDRELQSFYDDNGFVGAGLVVVGSGASGGMLVRDALGTLKGKFKNYKPADLDLAFFSGNGPTPTPNQYSELDRQIRKIVKETTTSIELCEYVNPTKFNSKTPSFMDILESFNKPVTTYYDCLPIILMLLPSYPVKVNQENLANLLQSLKCIHNNKGSRRWLALTDNIRQEASEMIKPTREKYFKPHVEEFQRRQEYRGSILPKTSRAVDEQVSKILAVTRG